MDKPINVLISGAANGVGRGLAEGFLASGARIAACDLDIEGLSQLNGGMDDQLLRIPVDITDETQVAQAYAEIMRRWERIDALVHCAGLIWDERTLVSDMSVATYRRSQEVNSIGTFLMCREAVRVMRLAGYGRIICIASAMALTGAPGRAHYVASKAAVLGFVKALAREVGEAGITVNAVAPGLIDSGPHAHTFVPTSLWATEESRRAVARILVPNDLVGLCQFLASPWSAAMTGQTLVIDGGSIMI